MQGLSKGHWGGIIGGVGTMEMVPASSLLSILHALLCSETEAITMVLGKCFVYVA